MKIENTNAKAVGRLLSALICDDAFLAEFKTKFEDLELFQTGFAKRLAEWCVEYHNQFNQAPKSHIMDVYDEKLRSKTISSDEMELMEDLLATLDERPTDGQSVEYLMSLAKKTKRLNDLNELKLDLETALEMEDITRADELIKLGQHSMDEDGLPVMDVFNSDMLSDLIFNRSVEPLFKIKGALGDLVNPHLTRDSLITFLAPEKRGKSQWLMEFSMVAAMSRLNVVVFQVGDLSDFQFATRLATWMSGLPRRPDQLAPRMVPVMDCKYNQEATCGRAWRKSDTPPVVDKNGERLPDDQLSDDYIPCDECRRMREKWSPSPWLVEKTAERVIERGDVARWQKIMSWRTKGRSYKMLTYPNGTINVAEIMLVLESFRRRDGFSADVVVIDYSDILKPEDSHKRERAQEDDRWRMLRRLSQEFNCLVLTASQGNKASYSTNSLTMDNISEDKRKNAHITGQLAINQSPQEKDKGICRIGWNVLREGDWSLAKQAVCLQDLNICAVHLDSYMAYIKD